MSTQDAAPFGGPVAGRNEFEGAAFDQAAFDGAAIGAFARAAEGIAGRSLSTYDELWNWSVDEPEQFWSHVCEWFDIPFSSPYTAVLEGDLPRVHWFVGARMNYADLVLRHAGLDGPAVISVADDGTRTELGWGELQSQVTAFAATLRRLGVQPGDRVVGYLTAGVEAVIGFLGAASIGATWAACGPDYGAGAAGDRLAQLSPRALVATTGYTFAGRDFDRRDVVADLVSALGDPALIEVPRLGLHHERADMTWLEAVAPVDEPLITEQVTADHPLWVLFSSGTTGIPKGIVHGHAGIAAVHLLTLGLQKNLGSGDRCFWFTTTNWMMWNLSVSCLTLGATLITYEGSPTAPSVDRLWSIAAAERATLFGVSPGYLQACANKEAHPGTENDFGDLRVIGVTGSPLPPAMNEWVAREISAEVPVVSTSGGTDVAAGFLGWAPGLPIRPGEIAGPMLGVAVDVWSPDGRPIVDEVGELVITRPMPSMPVTFWNDPDGRRYEAAYFDTFPGVWRQGDWATRHRHGGYTLHGRSDSTLNRGGVRIGSADIYSIVEALPQIDEALVLGVELPDGNYRMPMFLVLADGVRLDDGLIERISSALRTKGSPRHVPDEFHAVEAIPHTKTGKKLEIPLKRIFQGADPSNVLSPDAVDDPSVLDSYITLATDWRA